MLKRLTLFFSLVLLLWLAIIAMQYWAFVSRPLVVEHSTLFRVNQGQSLRSVLSELSLNPNIESFSPLWTEVFVRVGGRAHALQAGEYKFESGTTGRKIFKMMLQGDVEQYAQTIIEGWTFAQLMEALSNNPAITMTYGETDPKLWPSRIQVNRASVEGLFFPETYYFPKGTTDVEFLQRARRLMAEKLDAAWQLKSETSTLKSPYEAMILASIIEKETQLAKEWPLVAQVFHNRLQKGMRLQADPTVIYGLGSAFDGDLKREHLRGDTPYNSYVHKGLPPTPIAMPSFGALLSAVKPAQGPLLYFVAKGDGSHVFASNLDDHQKNVEQYIKGNS